MMGQHLYMNTIHDNFTVGTGRKVWCDRDMSMCNSFEGFMPMLECGLQVDQSVHK